MFWCRESWEFTQVRDSADSRGKLLQKNAGQHKRGEQRDAYTITLPSSVMASSTLSPLSPRIISLWARPEGIIGKQFSF